MRIIVAATLTSVLAFAAHAQTAPDGVLTPAPVPNVGPATVVPADRAGRIDGSDRAAPFSGVPNTFGAGTGQQTPATSGVVTPTAPAPSLSR